MRKYKLVKQVLEIDFPDLSCKDLLTIVEWTRTFNNEYFHYKKGGKGEYKGTVESDFMFRIKNELHPYERI